MSKRFEAIIEGSTIGKFKSIDDAVRSIMGHLVSMAEGSTRPKQQVECWVASGDEVVVMIDAKWQDEPRVAGSFDLWEYPVSRSGMKGRRLCQG